MTWRVPLNGRGAATFLLLAFGLLVLLPNWIALPPDDENLSKEIVGTVFQSKQLFAGHYPFWNPWVAFGVPEPLSQTLNFHPFLLFVEILPLGASIGAFYQLQLWIGLLAVWGVARHFGVSRSVAALCAAVYALSPTTVLYLSNFWPVNFLQFTLGPLLLLLLVKLLDSERVSTRALYAIGTGLCAAFMILDGHLGWIPDYAIPYLAFLATRVPRLRELWRWLALSVGVLALAAASHVYDVVLETSQAVSARNNQETIGMNLWRLLFYPITAPFHQGNNPRALALGGPFVVLVVIGLVYPLRHRYANGLRAGTVASFALWFVPVSWSTLLSTNYAVAAPFTIFGLLLAGLTLQALWQRFASWRWLVLGAAGLQILVLVAGFYPYYRDEVNLARSSSRSLKRALENQPVYRYFEAQPGIENTRIYLAPGADARMFRKQPDYKFEGWHLHGLRLVNGLFKGIDLHELTPARVYLRGEIRGDPRVAGSASTLDALDIGYVLAGTTDHVAPSLRRVAAFHLENPKATIVVYRNPGAWADAAVLREDARRIAVLPARHGCSTPGLLCADFAALAKLRQPHGVTGEQWDGTDLHLRLAPVAVRRVLMLTQLYRPGWEATLSDGRTVSGYRLFGGFTGFDLPADVRSATVSFEPTTRIALTALSWFAIFASLVAMAAVALFRRRRRLP